MIFTDLKLAESLFPVWTWRTECDRPASLRLQKGPEVTIGEIGAPVDGLWWHADDQPKLVILRGWPRGFRGPGERGYCCENVAWREDEGMVREYVELTLLPTADKLPPAVTEY